MAIPSRLNPRMNKALGYERGHRQAVAFSALNSAFLFLLFLLWLRQGDDLFFCADIMICLLDAVALHYQKKVCLLLFGGPNWDRFPSRYCSISRLFAGSISYGR